MRARTPTTLALTAALAAFGTCSCYFGAAAGAAFPVAGTAPRSPSGGGAPIGMDVGFQYDFRRLVRVMYVGSLQMSGGVPFIVRGQEVHAPYGDSLGLDVTVKRWPAYQLRVAARASPFQQEVFVGAAGARSKAPGSSVRTGFLGLNWQLLGDDEARGQVGVSLMGGVLVQRVSASSLGSQWILGPMLMLGMDWNWRFPYCLFIDTDCPAHVLHGR